ncbi:MAG: hypothetical protein DMG62_05460 [Acidobacteria bacterium]|nr:MAG: hypothetical protein DMG63_04605 [Acidobacteriota bacterium]PYY23901.1 MAG: hypothetical protein DMG62_05460 [Acidobacteriota bacterium]
MNRAVKSSFMSSQSTLLTDGMIRVKISYLDSATNYREFLPGSPGAFKRRIRWAAIKAGIAEHGALGIVVFISVALVTIARFLE